MTRDKLLLNLPLLVAAAGAVAVAGAVVLGGETVHVSIPGEQDPYDEAVTYHVASPFGTELAIKHYRADVPGDAYQFSLVIVRRGGDSGWSGYGDRLQREIDWTRLVHSGLGRQDNVLLNWDGDKRVTVAGPSDRPVPSGPDHLGDVRVSYAQYVRGHVDPHGPGASVVTLADVAYSVTRFHLGDRTSSRVLCQLRAEGRDDQARRWVGVDVDASGELVDVGLYGQRDGQKPTPVLRMISADLALATTYLPDATDRPTLTQGTIPGFPVWIDKEAGPEGPIQDDTGVDMPQGSRTARLVRHAVLYRVAFWRRATAGIFDLMGKGRFEAVFEYGLGTQVVTYRFAAPVPRDVAEEFARCETVTNIEHDPSALSRHLLP